MDGVDRVRECVRKYSPTGRHVRKGCGEGMCERIKRESMSERIGRTCGTSMWSSQNMYIYAGIASYRKSKEEIT